MAVINLDHINLRAKHEMLEQLRNFYSRVVGLTEGKRPPFREVGYWLYAGDRAVLHLSLADDSEDCQPGVRTTFNHMAFACTGQSAVEERLSASGIEYTIQRVPETDLVQLFFQDPAGNTVEMSFSSKGG